MKWFKFNINDLTPDEYEKWYALSSNQKKQKIDSFKFTDDKKRSVAGEMLAKKAIADALHVSPESIVIEATENGKPYIENSDIHFNISHSNDMVVCALSSKPVGIDIEKIRPINIKIAKRFFTNNEKIYLFGKDPDDTNYNTPPPDDMLKRFFEIWTAKEAYLKFTGKGIAEELNTLYFDHSNLTTYFFEDYVVTIYGEK